MCDVTSSARRHFHKRILIMTRPLPLQIQRKLLVWIILADVLLDRSYSLLLSNASGPTNMMRPSLLGRMAETDAAVVDAPSPTSTADADDDHSKRTAAKTKSTTSQNQTTKNTNHFSWTDRMQQVLEYRQQQGHTWIPKRHAGGLGVWWSKQRAYVKRYHHLSETEGSSSVPLNVRQLAILIPLIQEEEASSSLQQQQQSKSQQQWWSMFQQVEDAMEAHHCTFHELSLQSSQSTSTHHNHNKSLASWIATQRREYSYHNNNGNSFSEDQLQALERLDECWYQGPRRRAWEAHFQQLQAYHQKFGTTLVPQSHSSQLYHWVSRQRRKFKPIALELDESSYDRLDPIDRERYDKLQSIDFVWEVWNSKGLF